MEISYTRQPTVTTDKNGYTEDQQTQYITRTAKELVKKERKVQEDELSQDKNWIDSAKILYQMQEDPEGELPDDQALSTWALDYIGQTQYNLVSGANAAYEFSDADDMQKMAMRYAMETYEMKDITAAGAMRFAKGLATDPTTYLGLGTFGVGFGAKAAASQGAKKAFMTMLSKTSNLAGIEGAAYGAGESAIQQSMEVSTGARDEVDLGEVALTAGIGAVAGKGLGEGIEYLGRKFSKAEAPAIQEIQQEARAIETDIQANIGFAPELLGGSVNGLNYDEETGEFSFDPMRFMEGFLGGHVAKRIATNPRLNAKAKKEAMAYAQRTYDKLKDKPAFNYLTGTQRAVDDALSQPKVAKTIDKTTRDANFKNWFEGSKVVDDNGEPLVVYHGTRRSFSEFKQGEASATGSGDVGFWFTNDVDVAGSYANYGYKNRKEKQATSPSVMAVYLDIKNPKIITDFEKTNKNAWNPSADKDKMVESAKAAGYDGIIFRQIEDNLLPTMGDSYLADNYVVFYSSQIKSINNKGAFSKDGNILKSAMIVPVGAGAVAATQQDEEL